MVSQDTIDEVRKVYDQDPERIKRMSECAAAVANEFAIHKELRRFVQVMEDAAWERIHGRGLSKTQGVANEASF